MANKKRVYQADVMALPPIKMVLGEIPSPDPERTRKPGKKNDMPERELENAVQRLIMHLKEKPE
jgi:hypothetical protein